MNPPRSFRTERLLVRKPDDADAPDIFAYATDPEVSRFLPWTPHRNIEETRGFLKRCHEVWKDATAYPYVIRHHAAEAVIGMLEFRPQAHKVELGYVLSRPYWGQGLMTEALRPVVAWLQTQPQVYRIWAYHDVANLGSGGVLRKLGLRHEGRLGRYFQPAAASEPRDCEMYAWTRDPS